MATQPNPYNIPVTGTRYVTDYDWEQLRKFLTDRDNTFQQNIQNLLRDNEKMRRENQEIRKLVEDLKNKIKQIYLDNSLFDDM